MALLFSMVNEFLKYIETMFIAEKTLSSPAVDISIIFSKFIKGTKPAGIHLPSNYNLKRLKFFVNFKSKRSQRYLI